MEKIGQVVISSLKVFNDKIWTCAFKNTSLLSDNIAVCIIMFSVFCSLVFVVLRKVITKNVYVYGILDIIAGASVNYAIVRIPMIHWRINRALSVVSSIILNSNEYLSNFNHSLGMTCDSSLEIVKVLYFATEQQRKVLMSAAPEDLYGHFFKTYDEICKTGIWGYVQDKPSKVFVLGAAIIFIAILYFLYKDKFSKNYLFDIRTILKMCLWAAEIICFIYIFSLNYGSAICLISLLFSEIIFSNFINYISKKGK